MSEAIEFIQNNISAFDLIVFLITIYSMARCAAKGFMLSLLSFSKWLLALVITIVLVPKLNPWVEDYIESKFITDIGLGIFVYIISLFAIINIGIAVDCIPTPKPAIIFVAGPVNDCRVIEVVGPVLVPV